MSHTSIPDKLYENTRMATVKSVQACLRLLSHSVLPNKVRRIFTKRGGRSMYSWYPVKVDWRYPNNKIFCNLNVKILFEFGKIVF